MEIAAKGKKATHVQAPKTQESAHKNYFQSMVVDQNEDESPFDSIPPKLSTQVETPSSRTSVYSFDQLQAEALPTNLQMSLKAHDSGFGVGRNCLAICP